MLLSSFFSFKIFPLKMSIKRKGVVVNVDKCDCSEGCGLGEVVIVKSRMYRWCSLVLTLPLVGLLDSIGKESVPLHAELFGHVQHIFHVDDCSHTKVKGKHDCYHQTIVRHDGNCPQDDGGSKEDGVAVVMKELLLFTRLVCHGTTKTIV